MHMKKTIQEKIANLSKRRERPNDAKLSNWWKNRSDWFHPPLFLKKTTAFLFSNNPIWFCAFPNDPNFPLFPSFRRYFKASPNQANLIWEGSRRVPKPSESRKNPLFQGPQELPHPSARLTPFCRLFSKKSRFSEKTHFFAKKPTFCQKNDVFWKKKPPYKTDSDEMRFQTSNFFAKKPFFRIWRNFTKFWTSGIHFKGYPSKTSLFDQIWTSLDLWHVQGHEVPHKGLKTHTTWPSQRLTTVCKRMSQVIQRDPHVDTRNSHSSCHAGDR